MDGWAQKQQCQQTKQMPTVVTASWTILIRSPPGQGIDQKEFFQLQETETQLKPVKCTSLKL